MKKTTLSLLLSLFFVFGVISMIEAHPGRTASDGCHYCRTNCDSWGVPWNQRHCNGSPASTYTPPAPAPPPQCGDGKVNRLSEECDGLDLAGKTCKTLGFDGGTLSCSSRCELDTSRCTTTPLPSASLMSSVSNPNESSGPAVGWIIGISAILAGGYYIIKK